MNIDTWLEQILYAARTPFFVKFFSVLTELGGSIAVAIISICFAVVWFRQNRLSYITALFTAVVGSGVVAQVLKHLVHRPRPSMSAILETGYSFPSGHATAAFALYGFLTYAIWKMMPLDNRSLWMTLMGTLILLIGFSRLYLGVHYFSDVVGGYIVGALFVWVGIFVSKRVSTNTQRP